MRLVATAFTFGICSMSARGFAEPRAPRAAPSHMKSSPEGSISEAAYEKLLEMADADGDGRVSAGELESVVARYVLEQVETRFARLDRNGDGRVTRSEVPTMTPSRFARFDADGDGAFTASELSAVMLHQASARCHVVFARLDFDADGELALADAKAPRPFLLSKR